MEKKNYFNKGFTLIEILLVVALILVIGAATATFYARFVYQSAVRDAKQEMIGMLREAQINASNGKENSAWGVKLESMKLILFRGDSFSSRDAAFDQSVALDAKLIFSGFDELIFTYPHGKPTSSLSIVRISWENIQENFSLNSEGVVE